MDMGKTDSGTFWHGNYGNGIQEIKRACDLTKASLNSLCSHNHASPLSVCIPTSADNWRVREEMKYRQPKNFCSR